MVAFGVLGAGLAGAQSAGFVEAEQEVAPRNYGNFRIGGSTSARRPTLCLELSPLEVLSVEGCGTGSGYGRHGAHAAWRGPGAGSHLNIPPPVVAAVKHVPRGKGMAGLAQVRKQPVQTCNLQTDDSGNIKPGAKAVDARAAVALPVFDPAGEVRAVVGLAFMEEGEIAAERERAMLDAAASLPASGS